MTDLDPRVVQEIDRRWSVIDDRFESDKAFATRIALLAAECERERCAKVCDEYPQRDPAEDGNGYWAAAECAAAIRGAKP